jgi:dolichol-phosphate mannosyltransferase
MARSACALLIRLTAHHAIFGPLMLDPSPLPAPDTGAGALVILPTFNEVENLGRIVPAVLAVLPDARVLVVDDQSPDGTGDLADELAAADPRVSVLHRTGPRGLGPAYLDGFAVALRDPSVQAVFEMDADFSHPPRYLPDFLVALRDWDVVLGCRYMDGGGVEGWGLHRRLLSRGGTAYARAVLGLPFRDLTGGFKCFRRSVLEELQRTGALQSVRPRGYGFQIEVTWRVWNHGFRIGEVPIVFPDRIHGQSKMSVAIMHEALLGVWRMRFGPW